MYDVRKMPAGKVRCRRDLHQFYYDAILRRHAMQDSDGLRYFTWDSNGMNLLLCCAVGESPFYLRRLAAITIRCTSEVPS